MKDFESTPAAAPPPSPCMSCITRCDSDFVLAGNSTTACAGDILVFEGLAIQTEYFLGFGPSLNVSDVSPQAARSLIERIAPDIDDPKAEWCWIYELNGLAAPVYKAMYPMGYLLVASYLKEHGCNPIEAMAVPWQDFWESFQRS
jgi:uncharacterized protein YjaZ